MNKNPNQENLTRAPDWQEGVTMEVLPIRIPPNTIAKLKLIAQKNGTKASYEARRLLIAALESIE